MAENRCGKEHNVSEIGSVVDRRLAADSDCFESASSLLFSYSLGNSVSWQRTLALPESSPAARAATERRDDSCCCC